VLGLFEPGGSVLPDLGPQSVMAVRELLLVPLPAVPALSWLVVEPAPSRLVVEPAPAPGAFAVGLPLSQSMLRSKVLGVPPVAFGLVLVCAMAVPSINATTDAAVRIVRCI
jgi:hypothetical protein